MSPFTGIYLLKIWKVLRLVVFLRSRRDLMATAMLDFLSELNILMADHQELVRLSEEVGGLRQKIASIEKK